MQHGQEQGPFDGEFKMAAAQSVLEDGLAAGLPPEFFKDQRCAPVAATDSG